MQTKKSWDEVIVDYLYGELSESDARAFEQEMEKDRNLAEEVAQLRSLTRVMESARETPPLPNQAVTAALAAARERERHLELSRQSFFKRLAAGLLAPQMAAVFGLILILGVGIYTISHGLFEQVDSVSPHKELSAPAAPVAEEQPPLSLAAEDGMVGVSENPAADAPAPAQTAQTMSPVREKQVQLQESSTLAPPAPEPEAAPVTDEAKADQANLPLQPEPAEEPEKSASEETQPVPPAQPDPEDKKSVEEELLTTIKAVEKKSEAAATVPTARGVAAEVEKQDVSSAVSTSTNFEKKEETKAWSEDLKKADFNEGSKRAKSKIANMKGEKKRSAKESDLNPKAQAGAVQQELDDNLQQLGSNQTGVVREDRAQSPRSDSRSYRLMGSGPLSNLLPGSDAANYVESARKEPLSLGSKAGEVGGAGGMKPQQAVVDALVVPSRQEERNSGDTQPAVAAGDDEASAPMVMQIAGQENPRDGFNLAPSAQSSSESFGSVSTATRVEFSSNSLDIQMDRAEAEQRLKEKAENEAEQESAKDISRENERMQAEKKVAKNKQKKSASTSARCSELFSKLAAARERGNEDEISTLLSSLETEGCLSQDPQLRKSSAIDFEDSAVEGSVKPAEPQIPVQTDDASSELPQPQVTPQVAPPLD